MQVRLILELEESMPVLRYYTKSTGRRFTHNRTWYDYLFGTTSLKSREKQLKEWEQKESFRKLKESLVIFQCS